MKTVYNAVKAVLFFAIVAILLNITGVQQYVQDYAHKSEKERAEQSAITVLNKLEALVISKEITREEVIEKIEKWLTEEKFRSANEATLAAMLVVKGAVGEGKL